MNIRSGALLLLGLLACLTGCGRNAGAVPASGFSANTQTSQAAAGALADGSVDWLAQGMDAQHTGYNSLETILRVNNVGNLSLLWSFSTGAQIIAPVLIHNGVAFVNSGDGYLYALNAKTGTQIWKFQTFAGGGSEDNPVISNDRIIVGCLVGGSTQQNGVCALKVSNGALAWDYFEDCNCLPPNGLSAAPVATGSKVLVPYYATYNNGGPRLIALDSATGSVIWQYGYPGGNSGGASISAPAVAGAAVYFGQGYTNSVCSIALSNGSLNWCSPTGDSDNSPAVSNGVVYANTLDHGVFAFDTSNGKQLWQHTPKAGNYSGHDDPPAIAEGVVYVAGVGFSGNLYALNASNGRLIFHTASGSGGVDNTDSSPSIANGVAYVECSAGVCAFNATTGAALFTPGGGGSSQSSPAVVNGRVYDTCGPNAACAYALPSK